MGYFLERLLAIVVLFIKVHLLNFRHRFLLIDSAG